LFHARLIRRIRRSVDQKQLNTLRTQSHKPAGRQQP
jgi:hypothetical protein